MNLLVANLGSTSFKYRLFRFTGAEEAVLLAKGGSERVTDYGVAIDACLAELRAGGHLASTLATHFDPARPHGPTLDAADPVDRESSRPDLAILCYPVISLGEFAHAGSRRNLLGDQPSPELVQALSNELQVTKETPPTFVWHTVEDKTVAVENALLFASACRRAGVPFSLHIYEKGAHGLGFGSATRVAPPWGDQLLHWFKERAFTP
jgi:acetyl esterase/lipase